MPFDTILADLLAHTDGAIAALFLDWDGETVALMSARDMERDDIKIVGAQQGIFLTQLRRICTSAELGEPARFKVEFARAKVLSTDLKDGYYLVLLVTGDANESKAWRSLDRCRERLLCEI